MNRPLWQIFLCLLLLAFVLERAATAVMLGWGATAPTLAVAHALQVAFGSATALGIWWGRRWVLAAVVMLGATVVATAGVEGFLLGIRPAALAISRMLVAAVTCAALFLVLRHELAEPRTTAGAGPTGGAGGTG